LSFSGALLDPEKGGEFSFRSEGDYRVARRYVGDTAVLETRFCDGARRRAADGFLCDRARAV
jgi:hypothetical protein